MLYKLREPLRERIQERIRSEYDILCLKMPILVYNHLGVPNKAEVDKLLSLQCEDGGWEASYMYR